jgi:hypothetical protein
MRQSLKGLARLDYLVRALESYFLSAWLFAVTKRAAHQRPIFH